MDDARVLICEGPAPVPLTLELIDQTPPTEAQMRLLELPALRVVMVGKGRQIKAILANANLVARALDTTVGVLGDGLAQALDCDFAFYANKPETQKCE